MSLCIAAACREGDESRIVLCFDLQVSTSSYSSEGEIKFEEIDCPLGRLEALFAGPSVAAARELIALYRSHLAASENVKRENIEELLRVPLRLYKRRMVESLVQRRIALTYDQFLERKEQLEIGLQAKISGAIDDLTVESELILAGFPPSGLPVPRLIAKVAWEDVELQGHFACIGAGASTAERALHWRRQSERRGLAETIYNVYEAKRLGELSPLVGKWTALAVMKPDRQEVISVKGLAWLELLFRQLGPQGFPPDIELPPEFYSG